MNEESPRKYRKYWIIAVLALFVGVLGVAMADEALSGYLDNILCTDCTFDNATFINTTFPINESNLTLTTYLKKDGTDTMQGNLNMDTYNIIFNDTLTITTFIGQNSIPFSHGKYIMWDNPNNRLKIHNDQNDVYIGATSNTFTKGIINDVLNNNENICTNSVKAFISCGNQSSQITSLQNIDNTKVNKSGDNMTGQLNISGQVSGSDASILVLKSSDGTDRSWITSQGIQFWRFNDSTKENGYITYAIPGGSPNVCLLDATANNSNRSCFGAVQKTTTPNYRISLGNNTLPETNVFRAYLNGTIMAVYGEGTFMGVGLAGSGNAYPVRSDANGKLEVNRTAGAGITMKSPDGNSWCLTVTNGGTTLATSGACS